LPELEPFAELRVLVDGAVASGELLHIAHPPAELSPRLIPELSEAQSEGSNKSSNVSPSESGRKLLLIGPEGGFTDEELGTAINSGARVIHWPQSILRTETAAIVFSAMLLRS
jgi:16S rRNA (uracil1498-N3)-methyltransferase